MMKHWLFFRRSFYFERSTVNPDAFIFGGILGSDISKNIIKLRVKQLLLSIFMVRKYVAARGCVVYFQHWKIEPLGGFLYVDDNFVARFPLNPRRFFSR